MTSASTPEPPGAVAARMTGHAVEHVRRLSTIMTEVRLDDGSTVMVKRGSGPGAAPAEASGLRWLAEVDQGAVPYVHGSDEDWLVIDRITPGRPGSATAGRLGRDLARLHGAGAPAFGSAPPGGPRDAWIGLASMINIEGPAWPEWYAEHRVLPYVRSARDSGVLDDGEAALLARACDRLPEFAGPAEPPARLHGDLWNGNIVWGGHGRAMLIDPAAHGGHRETDLAMLQLFGCPHLDRVLAGYQEVAPLAGGWADRVWLHQLFPLLVHAVLFGRGYAERVIGTVVRYVGEQR